MILNNVILASTKKYLQNDNDKKYNILFFIILHVIEMYKLTVKGYSG